MTDTENGGGLSRRDMLKRSAVVGGAVLWTTPVVQSLASPAFAAGTQCSIAVVFNATNSPAGPCFLIGYTVLDPDCCDCTDQNNGDILACATVCTPIGFSPVVPPQPVPCVPTA
jgi:hypothetical protein